MKIIKIIGKMVVPLGWGPLNNQPHDFPYDKIIIIIYLGGIFFGGGNWEIMNLSFSGIFRMIPLPFTINLGSWSSCYRSMG